MNKTIYLPNYAKRQFESGKSGVWDEPVPYTDKPEPGFTCKIWLDDEDMECPPIDEKEHMFDPALSEALDDIIERMEFVQLPKPKLKPITAKPGDPIIMYFHMAGLTSDEEHTILKINKKQKYLEIEHTNNDDEPYRFNFETGRCLNDNNYLGAYRTIDKLV